MALNLTPIPRLEALSPLVFRVLGCNPGPFTLQGTNTYLIGNGPKKILIDTGNPSIPEYTENLSTALTKNLGDASISSIICTHWHRDHVGGVNDVIKTVIGRNWKESGVKVHKYPKLQSEPMEDMPEGMNYTYVKDGEIFETEGATLKVLYTPGHTDDHIALYLAEENAIFSADCILGEGTTIFEDLYTYMKSLKLLLDLKPSKIYPGHGPVILDPVNKIQEYIAHRNQRESQIMEALLSFPHPIEPMDIVNKVYIGISEGVKLGAANNVTHHLTKLEKEGKVEKKDEKWIAKR